jgi:prolyl-tRNA synthetase
MRFSELFTRTTKTVSQDDPSRNARLLTQAGFVDRLMAGVYSYLPMGIRVLTKIENIVRQEMNAIGAQEVFMPALQPKDPWEKTGRWDTMSDVMYKFKGAGDRDLCLGATHEEIITPLVGQFIHSYRDLPKAAYQIQTKFRNEARSKSGLLRGREFRMKDLYSFHTSQEDLDAYYERLSRRIFKIYRRIGLGNLTVLTYASGGAFCKYSHEFQTVTQYGEDTIYKVPGKDVAINKEIIDDQSALAELIPGYKAGDKVELESVRPSRSAISSNSDQVQQRLRAPLRGQGGQTAGNYNGCYGFGSSRVMGTIAEVLSDDKGWFGQTRWLRIECIWSRCLTRPKRWLPRRRFTMS